MRDPAPPGSVETNRNADLVLMEIGDRRLEVVKALRRILALGQGVDATLERLDRLPWTVLADAPLDRAEWGKALLDRAGATSDLAASYPASDGAA